MILFGDALNFAVLRSQRCCSADEIGQPAFHVRLPDELLHDLFLVVAGGQPVERLLQRLRGELLQSLHAEGIEQRILPRFALVTSQRRHDKYSFALAAESGRPALRARGRYAPSRSTISRCSSRATIAE